MTRPPHDTTRLTLPGTAQPCSDGHAFLLQGLSPDGAGILVRLRYHDSLRAGAYPLRSAGDTTTPGSIAAVRYLVGDVPHAFVIDSGAFDVAPGPNTITARARTSGLENAVRVRAAIEFREVPLLRDTIPCRDAP